MSRLHSLYKNGIVEKKKGGFSNYSMYEYIMVSIKEKNYFQGPTVTQQKISI